MKNPITRIALATLLLGTLVCSGCQSILPMPGATQVVAWQKAYRALKCWNPRDLYDMPSTEPLLFAMTRICLKVPGPQDPEKGYQTLVAIDAARNEVRAVRMKSVYSGGVHYTRWVTSSGTRAAIREKPRGRSAMSRPSRCARPRIRKYRSAESNCPLSRVRASGPSG